MNVHELPMIIFTVIAQMCVGSFIVLGVVQLVASVRHDARTVDRLTEPIVYAIGPAMVFGLGASMLHMNDITNTLNVFRNVSSSWLSREIVFGMAFAGLGFGFALVQWFKIGTFRLRQLLAAATAVAGIALIWAMSQIYYSLVTVPAWNTPVVPFHFFATAIMLGALAVGTALVVTTWVRRRHVTPGRAARPAQEPPSSGGGVMTAVRTRVAEINEPTTLSEWALSTRTIQWLAVASAVAGVAVLVSYPLHIADLAADPVGAASAEVFSGAFFTARLLLLGLSTVLLALFVFRTATSTVLERPQVLTALITAAFVVALVAELMGRSLHYDSMLRIGI
ncbi:dimethyl sulfoxide reductase anchor subunit [Georgenia satyanarayanai]|uniref:dimethyl sulfoxide reductase anchor subunit family protein n=1 Tax=Georgenia satyanarayanai TaxID=860221 RepID=UPI0020420FBD|nr:DmsC/YnfH family molybdoenzyme membrane anchor subunit [Georgenia satyanarayanai]MCM3662449.1 dimethyl sulfoxide reductase anchor subunit [Georgenia satyanarayanai]